MSNYKWKKKQTNENFKTENKNERIKFVGGVETRDLQNKIKPKGGKKRDLLPRF